MSSFSEILNADQPVLVDFFAEWCGPCKMMAPELEKLKQMAGNKLTILKVDIDKNPQVAMNFNIHSVPTLVLFRKGKMLWRQSGAMSATAIQKIIQNHVL